MSLLGRHAPDFTLENTAGKSVTLSETLDQGPTVVITFRAAWCSFCAEQLRTFSDLAYDLWYNHNTDVLPVSCDSVPNLVEMRDRYDLKLQLLSDPDFEVTRAYTEVAEHDRHGEYTRSGTFVVDTDRTVRYEQIAESAPDRTYANFVRQFIKRGYEDHYGTGVGASV
jgi:peroxiredoxin